MKIKDNFWIRALVIVAALMPMAAAQAERVEPGIFFGEFEGKTVIDQDGELRERDLRVKITPTRDGFSVNWISVTKRANGTLKRKEYTIDFLPTRRENIYRSGERKDMFGNAVPLDPLKGEPYVWARLHEDTMTVHALHVLEDGGYEMQAYARTRIPEGLRLEYSRVRDGEVLRAVKGTLLEVK